MFSKKQPIKRPTEKPKHPDTGLEINVIEELKKCKLDPVYFVNTYLYIDGDAGFSRFKLWPYQEDTIRQFVQNRFNVILKARQLGISQISAAFVCWFLIFYKRKTALCIANKQDTATELLDKIKIMLRHIPEWLLVGTEAIENADKKFEDRFEEFNKLSIIFKNGSKIKVSATTESAGRGLTIDLLIEDEAGSVPNGEKVWTALYPTIEKRGRAIVLSTPDGQGNFFHSLYTEAEKGINGFNPIKLHWSVRPNRTKEWGELKLKEIGESRFAQEYDCQFLGSGSPLFKANWLKTFENEWVIEPIFKGEEEDEGMWIWKPPVADHFYILSADTAAGEMDISMGDTEQTTKTDYSAACIYDRDTGEFVAEYYGKIKPWIFAEILHRMALMYHNPLFIFDNSGGWSGPIYKHFIDKNYWNIYREPKGTDNPNTVVNLMDQRHSPGLKITIANRNNILSNFEEFVTTADAPLFYSHRLFLELATFIYNGNKKRYEAASGSHDDLVFAYAMALHASLQWSLYAGQAGFMVSATMQALRSAKQKTLVKSTNPNRMPIMSKSYNKDSKFKQYFNTYYTDKKTKTSFVDFVDAKKKNDEEDDGLQRGAFEHKI